MNSNGPTAPPRRRARRRYGTIITLSLSALLSLSSPIAHAQSPQRPSPMQALQRAHWIAEGSRQPEHVLYVFVDANCPFCHRFWLALQPYLRQGLQVRDLMVGIIAPTSPAKAAAILEARDPAAALRENEQHWGARSDGGGGIVPLPGLNDEVTEILAHNLTLMQALGFQGTPGIIWVDASGDIHGFPGTPDPARLAQIVSNSSVPKP